ncbi:MAG TPA: phosphatase PAP2 family protein [Terriglobales bacterium]|jgi:membrane-associated phospholipid phosphatase
MRRFISSLLLLGLVAGLATGAQAQWAPVGVTLRRLAGGTAALPAAALHHWRATLLFAVSTGALIAWGDAPASGRIQSPSLERSSNTWSNRGLLYIEPAVVITATAIESRCLFCPAMGHMALVTLSAEAYATASVQTLKFAARRERPGTLDDADGGFNESGSSFPSGHAVGAFTMASVLAHQYPNSTWADWTAYTVAGGVTAARFTAKEHFPSDLLVGSMLGFFTGRCALQCR